MDISKNSNDDFESEIVTHLNTGEIVNPEFLNLKSRIDRSVEKKSDAIFNKFCAGTGATLSEIGLDDLSYGLPSNIHGIGSLGKKIDKTKVSHPLVDAAKELYDEYKIIHEKMKVLKGMVVTTTQKRAEKKEVENKVKLKKFNESDSLINALTKHLEEFKIKSGERAAQKYDYLMEQLKKGNWDINVVAPRATSKMGREQYRWSSSYRQMLLSITDGSDDIRSPSPKKKDKYVQIAIEQAQDSYMAWVYKMIDKIGAPVVKASVSGDPWVRSRLEVETKDGELQTWDTKMIINYSKYHKPFHQFPSRKEKEKDNEMVNEQPPKASSHFKM